VPRGDKARALPLCEEAARGFDATEMALYAAAARHRQGELTGGDAGRELIAAAESWMTAQKITNPKRMCALYAPGFPE
jgi:hypothetical protein